MDIDLRARAAEEFERLRRFNRLSQIQGRLWVDLGRYLDGEANPDIDNLLRGLYWEHDCSKNKCIVAIRNEYRKCPDCRVERPQASASSDE